MWMRRHGYIALAAVVLVLGARPSEVSAAGLGFARIAKVTKATGEGPVLAGDRVLVGTTRRGRAVVRVLGLDGSAHQVLRVPDAERTVLDMAASEQAVAVITATAVPLSAAGRSSRGVPAAFGSLAGPLRGFPVYPDDLAVSGPLVVAFGAHARDRVLVRDVTAPDAPARELPVPTRRSCSRAPPVAIWRW